MSAEYITEYNENTIIAAVQNMESNLRNFDYVVQYAATIGEEYALYAEKGRTELFHLMRAAQLVVHDYSSDFSDAEKAFYHGELLAMEFVNYLEPDIGQPFKMGYAQSFIRSELDKSVAENRKAETTLKHSQRMAQRSANIRKSLSEPLQKHGLNPLYEEFGSKATSKLTDEPAHQELAMMGFRMIITEALMPSSTNMTTEVMKKVREQMGKSATYQTTSVEPKIPLQTIIDLERNHAQSIQNTEEIIGEQDGINFVNWEDISYIGKTFRNEFDNLSFEDDKLEINALTSIEEIDNLIEDRLIDFNRRNEIIGENDLISVRGSFFSDSFDEEISLLFNKPNTEIRGFFGGICLVEAPSDNHLKNVLRRLKNQQGTEEPKSFILTPAIVIMLPKEIEDSPDGNGKIVKKDLDSIEIPLNYTNLTFKRIKALDLEVDD
jgi:hypothetical protein